MLFQKPPHGLVMLSGLQNADSFLKVGYDQFRHHLMYIAEVGENNVLAGMQAPF